MGGWFGKIFDATIAWFVGGGPTAALIVNTKGALDGAADEDTIPTYLRKAIPDIGGIEITKIKQYGGFNLTQDEAKAVQEKIDISSDDARKLLDAKRSDIKTLGAASYIVRLGPHRCVMLDTGRDAGIFEDGYDAALAKLKILSNEDEINLAAEAPNSMGINQKELNLVKKALVDADNDGLVIVGMHAPPLNPAGDEVPHYFRETEHSTADVKEILDYLSRKTSLLLPFLLTESELLKDWQVNKDLTLKPTRYFKSGGINTLLDWGIASRIEGKTEDFLRLCAGGFEKEGITKKVDLVLFGHAHKRIEYRLRWRENLQELRYFMDFYSQNPRVYYPSRKADEEDPVRIRVTNTKTPSTVVTKKAPNPDDPWQKWKQMEIPKYVEPLNNSPNPTKWWDEHRPILAQTAALGPMKINRRKANHNNKPGPTFQGFRVIFVRNNVIPKMRYVTIRNLRKNKFEMPWENVIGGLPDEDFEDDDQEVILNL